LAMDPNALIQRDLKAVPGWAVVAFLTIMPLLVLPAAWLLRDRGMVVLLAAFFGSALLAIGLTMAPLGRQALPALALGRMAWRSILVGTIGALVVSFAVTRFGVEPQGVKEALDVARGPGFFLESLVVMAILAPLAEELVFRGLLYGWLAGRWGGSVAWLVSSLAFAAAHVEPAHAILVLPLGLWFGWLRRRFDSLWPSLVAHTANNGLAVVAATLLDV